jgi:hypothetical protein
MEMQAVPLNTSSTIASWNLIMCLWADEHDGLKEKYQPGYKWFCAFRPSLAC